MSNLSVRKNTNMQLVENFINPEALTISRLGLHKIYFLRLNKEEFQNS